MFRTALSLICAIAIAAPTGVLAGERYERGYSRDGGYNRGYSRDGGYNRRVIQRVYTLDGYDRNRSVLRRDRRSWDRRDWERERYLRDRRDYRDYGDRRDYKRDRYSRPSIIIIPRISF
ncbi:hypothetical protein H6F86_12250 [Phormidium sp. FACHB-592]|uniref:Uncharacterized protein n=1 Tax=Stenomitos frigidus AS-A4 TaxID=2933935 RepID=A0ABV0KIR5_9CYAN|nr:MULTISPECIES: hypothetical protein [Cyanophyceae]MBD2037585.1 hypothetical protein [Leptolyngbya sp. FACHB-321]MBD2074644.1 hypothetical protein [Phormidium sp. FACHB-592]